MQQFISANNGERFVELVAQLTAELRAAVPSPWETWPAILDRIGLDIQQVLGQSFAADMRKQNWDFFPQSKNKAVDQVIQAYEKKFSDQSAASQMLLDPLGSVLNRLTAKHKKRSPDALVLQGDAPPAAAVLTSMSDWCGIVTELEAQGGKLLQADLKILCAQLNLSLVKKAMPTYRAASTLTNLHLDGFEKHNVVQKRVKLTRLGDQATRLFQIVLLIFVF